MHDGDSHSDSDLEFSEDHYEGIERIEYSEHNSGMYRNIYEIYDTKYRKYYVQKFPNTELEDLCDLFNIYKNNLKQVRKILGIKL